MVVNGVSINCAQLHQSVADNDSQLFHNDDDDGA